MTTKTTLAAVTAAVSIAAAAFGQTNAVRDFSSGFERFRQLGLPDVTGGTYGKLDVTQQGLDVFSTEYSRLESMRDAGMKGNAWKVKDLGGGTNLYVRASGSPIVAMDQKVYEEWLRKRQEAASKGAASAEGMEAGFLDMMPECAVASWSAADLKKDAERLAKYVEKSADDDDVGGMFRHDENTAAELVLFAALFHRSGCAAEANRIADKVFKAHRDPKRVVAAAMNRLADDQYGQACDRLAKAGDWSRFHSDVSLVTNRFQDGWAALPGARRLLDMVRVRMGQADPPPVKGDGLTAEEQQLARELATAAPDASSRYGGYNMHELWILPSAQYRHPMAAGSTNDVLARIKKRGMASVPLLVALLKDDTLTRRDRSQMGFGITHYGGSRASAEQIFKGMRRPATRGEIAEFALRPLLPMSDERTMMIQSSEMQGERGESLAEEIQAWYKENGRKTPQELAKLYLEKGSSSQQSYAINVLLRGKDLDQRGAEIESTLLALARNAEFPPSSIHQYVAMRREKAADFVEKVAAIYAVTNAPPAATVPAAGRRPRGRLPQEQMEQQRRQFVEGLRAQVTVRPFRVLVADFVAGTGSTQRATMALHEAVWREKPAEALTILLEAANKSDDPDMRCALLGYCANVRYAGMQGAAMEADLEEAGAEIEPPKPVELDPATHAALWKTLLDDKRGAPRPVREVAAWSVESLYAKAETHPMRRTRPPVVGLNEAVANLGDEGVELLVARARARLSGAALPALPDASKVDDTARRKVVADVLAAADPVAAVAKLSADERLALVACGRTNAALNAKLRPVANRIVNVSVAPEYSADAIATQLKGRSLDRETAGKLLQIARALSRAGHRFSCAVTRKGNLAGTEITLGKPPKPLGGVEEFDPGVMLGMGGSGTNRSDKTAHVDGWLMGGKFFARTSWPAVEAQPPVVASAEGATVADRLLGEAEQDLRGWVSNQTRAQQEGFWTAIEDAVRKTPAFDPISIGFEGYPAEGAKPPAKP